MDTEASDMAASDVEGKEPSVLGDSELYMSMRQWFLDDSAHSNEWRDNARRMFDFSSGTGQWKPETKKKMEGEKRAPITFNLVLPVVKAVSGIEVNTRHETIYLPRGIEEGDIIANEALSAASSWMADGCNARHQESQAFQDALKVGMGWVEERLDYELDPDGKYIEERLNPLEMWWDGAARAQNITDSRRRWRARKMNIADARAMFPGIADDDLNCSWPSGLEGKDKAKPIEERRLKSESKISRDPKGEVTILQCQWWEREKYHRAANPFTGELESLDEKGLKALQDKAQSHADATGQILAVESVEQTRRVYKQAFIGGKILKNGDCPRRDGFTLNCMTGEPDVNSGTWFGIVQMMEDPQMMANKWLSQATHIINTTAKGGILAEEGAFADIRAAEQSYAQPDAITWVTKGAIGSNKIMQKPGVGLASPYLQLMQMAMDSIPRVTGINMELMGLRDVNQAGVLEAQRKQAAMTILATIFDSLVAFRIEVGRTRLHFIQNYLADGRLIRILGPNGHKAVKLMKDRVVGEYDVVVDEAPTSPNQKEQVWAALQSVLPAFKEMITPPFAVKLLEYVPGIPQQLVDGFKELLEQQTAPTPEKEAAKKLTFRGQAAKVERDEAAALKDKASADKINAETVVQMASAAGQHIRNANEQAKTVGTVAKVLGGMSPPTDEFAIAPMSGGNDVPTLPMPQVRGGPGGGTNT